MTISTEIIARPYAIAAFEFALAKKSLPAWDAMLDAAMRISNDPQMETLLKNPRITEHQLLDIYFDLLNPLLDTEKKNFLHLLAENKRLNVLSDIALLFKNLRAEQERNITVDVSSAVPLDENYRKRIAHALSVRLQREVTLNCSVDSALLGGVMIRAGDKVIDGSVRGKLTRLLELL